MMKNRDMNLKIGIGYDVHALAEGFTLTLGGLVIPHNKGCVAHSDGDVLIHAICDALLGAAGLRDIGYYFPDSDDNYKGIDSKILLKKTYDLVKNENYQIVNIDSVIALQKPKINDYIINMRKTISQVIDINYQQINIKATTTENLGFEGREEGISASAVVLIQNIEK